MVKVVLEDTVLGDCGLAERALEVRDLLFSVSEHVLVQVALLRETVLASADQANERLLFRMRSEVVEEVVPLPENASAARRVLAEESLRPSLALHLKVFDIGEGPDRWNRDGPLKG